MVWHDEKLGPRLAQQTSRSRHASRAAGSLAWGSGRIRCRHKRSRTAPLSGSPARAGGGTREAAAVVQPTGRGCFPDVVGRSIGRRHPNDTMPMIEGGQPHGHQRGARVGRVFRCAYRDLHQGPFGTGRADRSRGIQPRKGHSKVEAEERRAGRARPDVWISQRRARVRPSTACNLVSRRILPPLIRGRRPSRSDDARFFFGARELASLGEAAFPAR